MFLGKPPRVGPPIKKVYDYDFVYSDSDTLEEEISEFFNTSDHEWISLLPPISMDSFPSCLLRYSSLGDLESLNSILYIALGMSLFKAHPVRNSKGSFKKEILVNHVQDILIQNSILYEYGIFKRAYANFVDVLSTESQGRQGLVVIKLTTLLYMMVLANAKDPDFVMEMASLEPPMDCFLFSMVTQHSESKRFSFPLKKILLLLFKGLQTLYGGSQELESLKNKTRQQYGLKPAKSMDIKSPVHDYVTFYQDMLKRYPNYVLPVPDDVIPCPDSFIRKQIAEFPTVLQPFQGPTLLPTFLLEALEAFEKGNYKSLGIEQLTRLQKRKQDSKESEKCARIRRLYSYLYPNLTSHLSILLRLVYNIVLTGFEPKTPSEQTDGGDKLEFLESADLSRHKQVTCKAITGILLLLLKIFKIHRNSFSFEIPFDERIDVVEFEHLCCVLADINCPLIFLKCLVAWFPSAPKSKTESEDTNYRATLSGDAWLRARDEPEELEQVFLILENVVTFSSFFVFCHKASLSQPSTIRKMSPTDTESSSVSTKSESIHPSCFRNFFTTVNVLRILQKISKRQYCRLLHLIQLKTCNIFKRISKINNPDLQHYTLKLLYSQIPFLGKKWKSVNMSIIAQIYMHSKLKLREDYLSGDYEIQPSEAAKQEASLRQLIKEYHEMNYARSSMTCSPSELDLILSMVENGSLDLKNPLHMKLLEPFPLEELDSYE